MIKISVYNPENYEFDEDLIVSEVEKTVKDNSQLEDVEVSVAVVPHEELINLARKYFDDETEEELNAHPVLSFVADEVDGEFVNPPDGVSRPGEIIVSWEKANNTSRGVAELAAHGTLHLLGIHHE